MKSKIETGSFYVARAGNHSVGFRVAGINDGPQVTFEVMTGSKQLTTAQAGLEQLRRESKLRVVLDGGARVTVKKVVAVIPPQPPQEIEIIARLPMPRLALIT